MIYILQTRRSNSKDWPPLVRANRAQLFLTAASLLSCDCCAEKIVKQALEELGGSFVPEGFKYRYVLRIVVQEALRHLRVCPMASEDDHCPETDHRAAFSFNALPPQERLVLFLTDVLTIRGEMYPCWLESQTCKPIGSFRLRVDGLIQGEMQ